MLFDFTAVLPSLIIYSSPVVTCVLDVLTAPPYIAVPVENNLSPLRVLIFILSCTF